MVFLQYIGEIIRFIVDLLIPGFAVVHSFQLGVRWRRGKEPQLLKPGFYVYWRMWTTVKTYSTQTDYISMKPVQATTRDKKKVLLGVTIRFRMIDVLGLATEFVDPQEAVVSVPQMVLPGLIASTTFDDLLSSLGSSSPFEKKKIERSLTTYMRRRLGTWCEIHECRINMFTSTIVFVNPSVA